MRVNTSCLLLSCLLAPAAAAQTVPARTDADWMALDGELDQLTLPVEDHEWMPEVTGWVRAEYLLTTRNPSGAEDISDFRLFNANLALEGDLGDSPVSYRIQYEMGRGEKPVFGDAIDNSPGLLEDAWLAVELPGGYVLTTGQFRAPIVRTGLMRDDRTLFFQRSFLGSIFEVRDAGIMLEKDWDGLRAALAIQDGIDGADTDAAFSGRVAYDLFGEGVDYVGGAYGAPDELCATVGAAIMDEEGVRDGVLLAFDAAVTYGRLAVAAELVTAEEGFDDPRFVNAQDPRAAIGEATPWGLTVSYMVRDDFEAAYRIDFLDTPDNEHIQTVGGSYYLMGHDLKFQFGLTQNELEGRDETLLRGGISASF